MRKRIVRIAAIVAALILLTGCAAFPQHSDQSQEPLSGQQTENIGQNGEQDGFSLELKSVVYESYTAYATFGLTAPEDTDFSDVLDGHSNVSLWFSDLQTDIPANVSYEVLDDGDEKSNTLKIVVSIQPIIRQGAPSAFGSGKTCEIVFSDVVYNRENEKELLASGQWKFVIELAKADSGELELLDSPVSTKVWVSRTGASESEGMDAIEEVTLTSIRVAPLHVEVSFEMPEPSDSFVGVFIDAAAFAPPPGTDGADYENIAIVMKDGTEISLFQSMGAKDVAILTADSPIVLEEVDCLRMSDGTRIPAK